MLRPRTLTTDDYVVALKPSKGYEQQLHVSLEQSTELGTLEIAALNSGTFTANAADVARLLATPQELVAVAESDLDGGAENIVVSLSVLYADNTLGTATATFSNPAYSNISEKRFPRSWAAEVIADADKLIKAIAGIASINAEPEAIGAKITFFGLPSLSTFRKIPCKTQLNWDPRVAMPEPVRCGRDPSAFIKPGDLSEGALEITSKVPTFADSLARLNGLRVTGLIKEVKEDKLNTMNVFVMGLIMTARANVGESQEDVTLAATSRYEDVAILVAQ